MNVTCSFCARNHETYCRTSSPARIYLRAHAAEEIALLHSKYLKKRFLIILIILIDPLLQLCIPDWPMYNRYPVKWLEEIGHPNGAAPVVTKKAPRIRIRSNIQTNNYQQLVQNFCINDHKSYLYYCRMNQSCKYKPTKEES